MVRDEMVDGEVLSLELAMATILLNVKCRQLDFIKSCPNPNASESEDLFNVDEDDEEEEDDLEYSLTLNLHNSKVENSEGPCQLNLIEIEKKEITYLIYQN